MYFPVADINVQPWLPPLVAFGISFFTSMGGVSGAFLLLPFQISVLGFDSPAVSATNHIFNIVAIPSGVYQYIKQGRMVWPITWAVIIGTLPGVLAGAIIRIKYLPDPTAFKRFAAIVLLYIGIRLAKDLLNRKKEKTSSIPEQSTVNQQVSKGSFTIKEIQFIFEGKQYRTSTPKIMTLCLAVGMIGGIYGIGGGAIIAPFLVSFFELPVYTVAGAALMGTMITSIAGVIIFQTMALFYKGTTIAPDWPLGLLFGLGGFAGMYLGAKTQRHIKAQYIKAILALCILFTAFQYINPFQW
jgi:uncharacterized membrane protein YfcA